MLIDRLNYNGYIFSRTELYICISWSLGCDYRLMFMDDGGQDVRLRKHIQCILHDYAPKYVTRDYMQYTEILVSKVGLGLLRVYVQLSTVL